MFMVDTLFITITSTLASKILLLLFCLLFFVLMEFLSFNLIIITLVGLLEGTVINVYIHCVGFEKSVSFFLEEFFKTSFIEYIFKYLLIESVNKYLLIFQYVPDTVLRAGYTLMKTTDIYF